MVTRHDSFKKGKSYNIKVFALLTISVKKEAFGKKVL